MKRPNIKCPYCGSQAFLRPASVLNKHGPVYDGENTTSAPDTHSAIPM